MVALRTRSWHSRKRKVVFDVMVEEQFEVNYIVLFTDVQPLVNCNYDSNSVCSRFHRSTWVNLMSLSPSFSLNNQVKMTWFKYIKDNCL